MRFGKRGRLALPLAALAFATAAQAQTDNTVTLRSADGFTQLRGELVDYDGSTYTLRTQLGTLEIDAMQVKCEGAACPEDALFGAEFGVVGSNTIGSGLMPALIQGYADTLEAELVREIGAENGESLFRILHEDGREMAAISLDAEGSGAAFPALARGEAALGLSSRRARDADIEALAVAGIEDPRDTAREHVVALDGLIAITHPKNPVRSISIGDLARVFSGEITNWAQLGGRRAPIQVFARNAESGTYDTFRSLVLQPAGVELGANARSFDSDVALSDAVAAEPTAIGFTTLAATRASKPLGIRQSCGLLSRPTAFAIKTEEYPLSRRLYVYEAEDQPAHARRLLAFSLSPEAQPLIQEAGFVDTAPDMAALNEMGGRIVYSITTDGEFSLPAMREMLAELQDAERLSTTFRFTPGSSQLDPLSQREAESLADRLAEGDYAGKEVLLVGFTDAIGEFELNRQLGARRASVVLQAIRDAARPGALAGVQISTRGYGELMPVGCNETFGGRLANRRVEVWLRDLAL